MNLKYQFQIRRIINTLNKNELYNLLLENNIRLKKSSSLYLFRQKVWHKIVDNKIELESIKRLIS
jgi:hypothetical protein